MAEHNNNIEHNEGELLHRVCAVPPHIKWLPDVDVHEVTDNRKSFVLDKKFKWANGTQIRYYFINDSYFDKNDKNVVRESFQEWANLGISLSFKEVTTRRGADVAIEFSRDQSAWSYVGTDCRSHKSGATMHFGWSLSDDPYGRTTALHEIGHAIGLQHEHQNPNSGIVWDEQAVIRYFKKQGWDEPTTRHNILDHIPSSSVFASKWDPVSVMEYHFAAGLILEPDEYRGGIKTNYVLSPTDIKWIREYYPLNGAPSPLGSAPLDLQLKQGEEGTFSYVPSSSGIHRIGILGDYDALIVVSDKEGKHIAASDDSLTDRHAEVFAELQAGEEYLIRVRLYGTDKPGASSVLFAKFLSSD